VDNINDSSDRRRKPSRAQKKCMPPSRSNSRRSILRIVTRREHLSLFIHLSNHNRASRCRENATGHACEKMPANQEKARTRNSSYKKKLMRS